MPQPIATLRVDDEALYLKHPGWCSSRNGPHATEDRQGVLTADTVFTPLSLLLAFFGSRQAIMTGDPSNPNYLSKLVKLAAITTAFSLLVPLGPSTVSAESNFNGKFLIGDKSIPIENLKPTDLAPLLKQNWFKFDRYVKETPVIFGGQTTSIYWPPMTSLPIPTRKTLMRCLKSVRGRQDLVRGG